MATRQSSRFSSRQFLVPAVIALAACSSSASAQQYPMEPTMAPSVNFDYNQEEPTTTTAPSVNFGYPDTTPTVTDTPEQQTMDNPTQGATEPPQTPSVTTPTESSNGGTTGSLPTTQGSSDETNGGTNPTTQGSSSNVGTTGSLPTQASTEGSIAQAPSTGNSSGAHATFGDVTSGSGKCVVGNPNAYISTKDVEWVWTQRMSKYVPEFKNYIFDQLVTNKGKLPYCVRWDSTNKLSKSVASKFEAMLNRQFKAWNDDDSLGTIYSSEKDADGVPQCPEACYKHKDFAASADTSGCKGKPFGMSLWPTLGQGGGAGGDWGQRVDAENMLASLDQEQLTIVAHEIDHGFGLPDFYETTDQPNEDFPVCIMKAGSSPTITPGDGWMLRRVLEHVKSRYKF
ncbi:hypothetical protein PHYSODRAFT_331399 [Phytophthora sojae]|uniref:Neutral zinc metallopeptidase, Zn-binding site n=1 Tax=Phytophthora sojae (strain P6497) TaxID=1094619 RepID=G4ZE74_PHYSP|nr:hypothetical protein PHYSODRAFT_331399 [Phytophthora sojae]EGZ17425.1 hypothetical protein PHYSODRAFT_331399 [Phytophthora sojae]|eukprot:XP_009526483.1 hypothetical protein PHYSODRAFT_331399 [Phytophthora sojae]